MESANQKVTPISGASNDDAIAAEIMENTNKDIGRVAIFVAILAVVLVAVFYFGLSRSLTGISEKVAEIDGMKAEMAGFDARVKASEAGVANAIGIMKSEVDNKIAGMETKVGNTMTQMEATMGSRMNTMEARVGKQVGALKAQVDELADLPKETKRMVMGTMLQELSQTAAFIGGEAETPEQRAIIEQAVKLLQEARGSMTK
jgi:hypothetical protein